MKTIPFTAAHTRIAYIWNYPSSGSKRDRRDHFKVLGQKIMDNTSRALISKIHCKLLVNQKRVEEFNVQQ